VFTKGADARVLALLRPSTPPALRAATDANLHAFATRGLRTLALATRVLEPRFAADWAARYRAAAALLDGRDDALDALAAEVETELELVGVTAIEDKLQEGVPAAVATLLDAGAKVWVITGDKQETAINIAIACRLIRAPQALLILNAGSTEEADAQLAGVEASLAARSAAGPPRAAVRDGPTLATTTPIELVVDGATLSHMLGTHLEKRLAAVGAACASVVVCRSSPSQKAAIVCMMRDHEAAVAAADAPNRLAAWYRRSMRRQAGRMLSVGDGANDVAMIQAADVGVGIIGKEGRQAVNSADFAVSQFRFLVRLLLVHGSLSAYRLSR
jgi:magnesium-transporting ATPase (P-type)